MDDGLPERADWAAWATWAEEEEQLMIDCANHDEPDPEEIEPNRNRHRNRVAPHHCSPPAAQAAVSLRQQDHHPRSQSCTQCDNSPGDD